MARYRVSLARSATKQLRAIDRTIAQRIILRLDSLAENPRPAGCVRLQGARHLWRIRVGDYRVVYEIDEAERKVDVSIIRHRRDVYRL